MRLRTRQLACLLLLVSSLGLRAAASEPAPGTFYANPIAALLFRHAASQMDDAATSAHPSTIVAARPSVAIVADDRFQLEREWGMRPPAAFAASFETYTAA